MALDLIDIQMNATYLSIVITENWVSEQSSDDVRLASSGIKPFYPVNIQKQPSVRWVRFIFQKCDQHLRDMNMITFDS
jgi:hypothetical protein